MDNEEFLDEIDKRHQKAKKALEQNQFDNYISIFSDKLEYQQISGKTIDKKTLAKDIASYFGRLKASTSQYTRQNYSIEENKFTEKLFQKATASIKVYLFFTRKWTVEREGIYQWGKHEGIWQIEKVEILREKVY